MIKTSRIITICLLTTLSFGLAPRASATWSILLADRASGEVAVGSATCWDGQWLVPMMPVVRVGQGVANNQASVDHLAVNRMVIWEGLAGNRPPVWILEDVDALDPWYEYRQIAVIDMAGRRAVHTGTEIPDAFNGHLSGEDGSLVWSVQGNRLTGEEVLVAIRDTVLTTQGDMAERLMAGMEAARSLGGDGRCSCNLYRPDWCGVPPLPFEKSSHVGFMIVARVGDQDGVCALGPGCASGNYFMNLEVGGWQGTAADPVHQLRDRMEVWRDSWTGRPDHLRSRVSWKGEMLTDADGSSGTLEVKLADWRGVPLTHGGAVVKVIRDDQEDAVVQVDAVLDRGNGRYDIPVHGLGVPGKDRLRIVVDDGQGEVTLYPFAEIGVARREAISTQPNELKGFRGRVVMLDLDGGPGLADEPYLVLCSRSGTVPGFQLQGTHVPLVPDEATLYSLLFPNGFTLVNTSGQLDEQGESTAAVRFTMNDIGSLMGGSLSFSLICPGYASAAVTLPVQP